MQRVFHLYQNKSRLFDIIENLYQYVSDVKYENNGILWVNDSFTDICQILTEYIFEFRTPEFKQFRLDSIETPQRPKEVTVCLSGGKDSAAVAYYYKQLGYTVHLYHAKGVNKAYGDEYKAAIDIAEYLGCDIFIDTLQIKGTHRFIEHPLKNYLIANGAIHYCLAKGYTPRIAFGNFSQASIYDNPFEVCGGDCVEMWQAYEKIIKPVIPAFELCLPLQTNATTFDLLSQDWQLFGKTVSCMSPYRFRASWAHRTEQKYRVRLFDNRCGCCWKCCIEATWLMDFDKIPFNRPYYAHCFSILERTIKRETGEAVESPVELWEHYMWYPVEQSKLADRIQMTDFYKAWHTIWKDEADWNGIVPK